MAKKPSIGVILFGVVLILGALFQMFLVYRSGYEYYCRLHQEYAPTMLYVRYLVSWGIKLAGLVLGFGILKLNDWARKLLIAYYVFIIATVHLKHAYPAYMIHLQDLDKSYGHLLAGFTFVSLAWPALIIQRGLDIVLACSLSTFLPARKSENSFSPSHRQTFLFSGIIV